MDRRAFRLEALLSERTVTKGLFHLLTDQDRKRRGYPHGRYLEGLEGGRIATSGPSSFCWLPEDEEEVTEHLINRHENRPVEEFRN